MKILLPIVIFGVIVMYFMNAAFHINYFTTEAFIHNSLRFLIGFFLLGVWVWHKHKPKFKIAAFIILALFLSDSSIDYFRGIDNLSFEMIIHDAFILFWSALIGFFYMRNKQKHQNNKPDTPQTL